MCLISPDLWRVMDEQGMAGRVVSPETWPPNRMKWPPNAMKSSYILIDVNSIVVCISSQGGTEEKNNICIYVYIYMCVCISLSNYIDSMAWVYEWWIWIWPLRHPIIDSTRTEEFRPQPTAARRWGITGGEAPQGLGVSWCGSYTPLKLTWNHRSSNWVWNLIVLLD